MRKKWVPDKFDDEYKRLRDLFYSTDDSISFKTIVDKYASYEFSKWYYREVKRLARDRAQGIFRDQDQLELLIKNNDGD